MIYVTVKKHVKNRKQLQKTTKQIKDNKNQNEQIYQNIYTYSTYIKKHIRINKTSTKKQQTKQQKMIQNKR